MKHNAAIHAIACAMLVSAAANAANPATATTQPNCIFSMADDLGYADVGCDGQRRIRTPNIDRLAEQGTRYTQFYAGCTVCAPTRSVLMTGLHTGHTRVRGNFGASGGRVPLRPQDVTVAEVLKKARYATGIVGKWGLGEPDTTAPLNRPRSRRNERRRRPPSIRGTCLVCPVPRRCHRANSSGGSNKPALLIFCLTPNNYLRILLGE